MRVRQALWKIKQKLEGMCLSRCVDAERFMQLELRRVGTVRGSEAEL